MPYQLIEIIYEIDQKLNNRKGNRCKIYCPPNSPFLIPSKAKGYHQPPTTQQTPERCHEFNLA